MVKSRVDKLRELMLNKEIDTYIIPTADYHESEYVGEYFQARKYISGFTGSAGILIITATEGCLLTDGRYFLQAEAQLKDSGITLYKSGEKDVPDILELALEKTPENGVAAFDGKVINAKLGTGLGRTLEKKGIKIKYDEDLMDEIWEGRPKLKFTSIYALEEKYTGKSSAEKLKELRRKMAELGAKYHILTSLDDIAWLYNFRADDIPHNPVALAYTIISEDEAVLFINKESLTDKAAENLKEINVTIFEYDYIYEYLHLNKNTLHQVLIELSKINYAIYKNFGSETELIDGINPTTLLKSIKNEVEIRNIREAHRKDGIAVTKFMYWLKNNIGKESMTETSVAKELSRLRNMQEGFLDLSFETIAAYKEHAAIIHYTATEESDVQLMPEGMLLVDSGGHYLEGTTDVTRTFVLGEVSREQKLHYTTVVKSMLRLANVSFLHGCGGQNFDILARGPIWELNLDYKCGTGHGVGYLLSVHEAPNGFRWKTVPERNDSCIFEPGMVTTDEPGIYIEGSHGIRIENELLCIEKAGNEYGRFLRFEDLTLVPIDLDGIEARYLDESDRKNLNNYHKMVYRALAPYMEPEERDWLKFCTREI